MENVRKVERFMKNIRERALKASVACEYLLHAHADKILGCLGVVLIAASVDTVAHAQVGGGGGAGTYDQQIVDQICKIVVMSQGYFGALVMSVAGLVAIISAATGGYRAAMNAIAVGAGAWLVRPMLFLFFGESAADCSAFGFNIPIGG